MTFVDIWYCKRKRTQAWDYIFFIIHMVMQRVLYSSFSLTNLFSRAKQYVLMNSVPTLLFWMHHENITASDVSSDDMWTKGGPISFWKIGSVNFLSIFANVIYVFFRVYLGEKNIPNCPLMTCEQKEI